MPLADLPFPLRDASPVSIGSNLYLIGGWNQSPIALVLKYDAFEVTILVILASNNPQKNDLG